MRTERMGMTRLFGKRMPVLAALAMILTLAGCDAWTTYHQVLMQGPPPTPAPVRDPGWY